MIVLLGLIACEEQKIQIKSGSGEKLIKNMIHSP